MITHPRNLRTGDPVWQDYVTPRLPTQKLTGNMKTDILIIGAGISGAMLAQALTGHGMDVMIVDRRKPLSGSTAASTALLQYELDVPLIHLIDKIGRDKAIHAWRRSKLSIESMASKVRELDIPCAYERRDTLYLSGNILNPAGLAEECAMRNEIGLRGQMLSAAELYEDYGVKAKAGILSWDNMLCNPVQLAGGLFKAACAAGAEIYAPVTIGAMQHHKDHYTIDTDEGHTIQARIVIFATGCEVPSFIHKRKHKIISTWAVATKPLSKIAAKDFPLIWEASAPYLYMRMTEDNRLICGGEDADFADDVKRDALIPAKTAKIEKKLRAMLPDLDFEVDHRWAGSFGTSTTGLPSIGAVPGMKNIYAVMAYGGNGITFSNIAAEIVSARILGGRDPDEALFAF